MDEASLNRLNTDRLQSRQIDELIGLSRGLIADGALNQQEIEFLEKWLATNLAVSNQPLISLLYQRIREILVDGIADQDECLDLFNTLQAFTADRNELGEAAHATTLPLCAPAPELSFAGRTFCFTGTFTFGQRRHCEEAVIQRGATCGTLTRKTDVLVIGSYATESWKHSSFGNKILKAVELREAGLPIRIVSESHWVRHL